MSIEYDKINHSHTEDNHNHDHEDDFENYSKKLFDINPFIDFTNHKDDIKEALIKDNGKYTYYGEFIIKTFEFVIIYDFKKLFNKNSHISYILWNNQKFEQNEYVKYEDEYSDNDLDDDFDLDLNDDFDIDFDDGFDSDFDNCVENDIFVPVHNVYQICKSIEYDALKLNFNNKEIPNYTSSDNKDNLLLNLIEYDKFVRMQMQIWWNNHISLYEKIIVDCLTDISNKYVHAFIGLVGEYGSTYKLYHNMRYNSYITINHVFNKHTYCVSVIDAFHDAPSFKNLANILQKIIKEDIPIWFISKYIAEEDRDLYYSDVNEKDNSNHQVQEQNNNQLIDYFNINDINFNTLSYPSDENINDNMSLSCLNQITLNHIHVHNNNHHNHNDEYSNSRLHVYLDNNNNTNNFEVDLPA